MTYVVIGVAVMVAVAVCADNTLPRECRTCGHPYTSRQALRRHRRLAHRD